jgi:hypothetical protein
MGRVSKKCQKKWSTERRYYAADFLMARGPVPSLQAQWRPPKNSLSGTRETSKSEVVITRSFLRSKLLRRSNRAGSTLLLPRRLSYPKGHQWIVEKPSELWRVRSK